MDDFWNFGTILDLLTWSFATEKRPEDSRFYPHTNPLPVFCHLSPFSVWCRVVQSQSTNLKVKKGDFFAVQIFGSDSEDLPEPCEGYTRVCMLVCHNTQCPFQLYWSGQDFFSDHFSPPPVPHLGSPPGVAPQAKSSGKWESNVFQTSPKILQKSSVTQSTNTQPLNRFVSRPISFTVLNVQVPPLMSRGSS